MINLFTGDCGSLDAAFEEVRAQRAGLLRKLKLWRAKFARVFGGVFSERQFEEKVARIGRLSGSERALVRRGQFLKKREKESEAVLAHVDSLKGKGEVLNEISTFCENWDGLNGVFLYFQLKQKRLKFFKAKYDNSRILDLSRLFPSRNPPEKVATNLFSEDLIKFPSKQPNFPETDDFAHREPSSQFAQIPLFPEPDR